MKNNFKYIFIQLTFIFLFIFVLPPLVIKEKFAINQEGGQATFNLSEGKSFTQTVTNHLPYLNSISLQLKNPLIKNNSLIEVKINDTHGNNLQEFSFYGANVGDPSWIKLKFLPLNYSDFDIQIFADEDPQNLYLYVNQTNQIDLKTTSYLPGFKNRFIDNVKFQLNQFSQRPTILNVVYLATLIILNLLLISKKRLSS